MKNLKPKNIDGYIASAPKESKAKLLELRKLLKSLAPKAEEGISYGMPAYKLDGKNLVCFAGYKHHIGFYPMSGSFLSAYQKDLKNYVTSKGAVQFPLEKPLPIGLIKKLLKGKMKEIQSGKEVAETKKGRTTKNATGEKDNITKHTHYHKDGSVWGKGSMMGGKMHGYFEWFRKDGTKMRSGYFDKGKQVGKWTTYDQKGRIYKITMMK